MSEGLPDIVRRLARAGWGCLSGRRASGARVVLTALSQLLPASTASGQVTVCQVADVASLSRKWTAVILRRLESMGLIAWERGWLDAGTPRPGWVRVSKRALWALIDPARRRLDTIKAQRAAETRRRIRETLRLSTQRPACRTAPPDKRKPLSKRWELSSPLPPNGEVPDGRRAAVGQLSTRKDRPVTTTKTPFSDGPTRWVFRDGAAPLVEHRGLCEICHKAPHPETQHHPFIPATASAERAHALGWPEPRQDGLW